MTNFAIATDYSIKKDALKAKKNEGKEILLLDFELFIGGSWHVFVVFPGDSAYFTHLSEPDKQFDWLLA